MYYQLLFCGIQLIELFPIFCVQIREACQDMVLSEEQLKDIMDRLLKNINEGLSKENHDSAAVKCYVTYVQDLPSGKGKFFRLDFAINNCLLSPSTSTCRRYLY